MAHQPGFTGHTSSDVIPKGCLTWSLCLTGLARLDWTGLLDAGRLACSFQHSDVHFASHCQREVLRTDSQEGRFWHKPAWRNKSLGIRHPVVWGDTCFLVRRGSTVMLKSRGRRVMPTPLRRVFSRAGMWALGAPPRIGVSPSFPGCSIRAFWVCFRFLTSTSIAPGPLQPGSCHSYARSEDLVSWAWEYGTLKRTARAAAVQSWKPTWPIFPPGFECALETEDLLTAPLLYAEHCLEPEQKVFHLSCGRDTMAAVSPDRSLVTLTSVLKSTHLLLKFKLGIIYYHRKTDSSFHIYTTIVLSGDFYCLLPWFRR